MRKFANKSEPVDAMTIELEKKKRELSMLRKAYNKRKKQMEHMEKLLSADVDAMDHALWVFRRILERDKTFSGWIDPAFEQLQTTLNMKTEAP